MTNKYHFKLRFVWIDILTVYDLLNHKNEKKSIYFKLYVVIKNMASILKELTNNCIFTFENCLTAADSWSCAYTNCFRNPSLKWSGAIKILTCSISVVTWTFLLVNDKVRSWCSKLPFKIYRSISAMPVAKETGLIYETVL